MRPPRTETVVMRPGWQGCMASGLCDQAPVGFMLFDNGGVADMCRRHLDGLLVKDQAELVNDGDPFIIRQC